MLPEPLAGGGAGAAGSCVRGPSARLGRGAQGSRRREGLLWASRAAAADGGSFLGSFSFRAPPRTPFLE